MKYADTQIYTRSPFITLLIRGLSQYPVHDRVPSVSFQFVPCVVAGYIVSIEYKDDNN